MLFADIDEERVYHDHELKFEEHISHTQQIESKLGSATGSATQFRLVYEVEARSRRTLDLSQKKASLTCTAHIRLRLTRRVI